VAGEPILIVDDNVQNLKLARVVLANGGYDVRTAADAEEALALLRTSRPRAILMDLQLPGMDGLQLTRQLKADRATQGICIIALTAYAMKGDEEKAFAAGCDAYVTKPIDTERLPEIVRSQLSGRPEGGRYRRSPHPSSQTHTTCFSGTGP
jgi:CheY-like chemotaxis protein